jgi:hypothetical protein
MDLGLYSREQLKTFDDWAEYELRTGRASLSVLAAPFGEDHKFRSRVVCRQERE